MINFMKKELRYWGHGYRSSKTCELYKQQKLSDVLRIVCIDRKEMREMVRRWSWESRAGRIEPLNMCQAFVVGCFPILRIIVARHYHPVSLKNQLGSQPSVPDSSVHALVWARTCMAFLAHPGLPQSLQRVPPHTRAQLWQLMPLALSPATFRRRGPGHLLTLCSSSSVLLRVGRCSSPCGGSPASPLCSSQLEPTLFAIAFPSSQRVS